MANLAIAGGVPISREPIASVAWPPVSEAVGDKLKELYLSRAWSFNCAAERDFAAAFAAYHGAKHGILMVNGTVTLQAALMACGVGPGDEVIVPALTWMATAMAAHYIGAIPVFVDIEPDTLCLDPVKFEAAVTARTKAVIPVHLYGGMADLERIDAIAKKHDIVVIEDCAHMQGGGWNGRGVGSWGAVGSFSFQQSKTLSAGEAGICLTNDAELAEKLFRIKHIGYGPADEQGRSGDSPAPGLVCHNFRATGFQALILHEQLKNLATLIETYNRNAEIIRDGLASVAGVRVQAAGRLADPQGYYSLVFLFDEAPLHDIPLTTILEACHAEGLPLGSTYGPVYQHKLFNLSKKDYRIAAGGCEVADGIAKDRAAVMMHPRLGAEQAAAEKMVAVIAKVAHNHEELRQHQQA